MITPSSPRQFSGNQRPQLRDGEEMERPAEPDAPESDSTITPTSTDAEAGTDEQSLSAELAERTADLQRVKAEFDNYRKRTQRERLAIGERARADVLRTLLPVLDIIDDARAHDDTAAAFDTVPSGLQERLAAFGVRRFGTEGDPFDPARHEALAMTASDGLEHPICTRTLQPGHLLGEILLRPARVEVGQSASGSHRHRARSRTLTKRPGPRL